MGRLFPGTWPGALRARASRARERTRRSNPSTGLPSIMLHSESQPPPELMHLDEAFHWRILTLVGVSDLAMATCTCKRWSSDLAWRELYRLRWNNEPDPRAGKIAFAVRHAFEYACRHPESSAQDAIEENEYLVAVDALSSARAVEEHGSLVSYSHRAGDRQLAREGQLGVKNSSLPSFLPTSVPHPAAPHPAVHNPAALHVSNILQHHHYADMLAVDPRLGRRAGACAAGGS